MLLDQQGRATEALEVFADNTLRHLRDEGKLLADGIDFPTLETSFRYRHALVVARGPGFNRDLKIVRGYVRDFRPISSRSTVERTRRSRRLEARRHRRLLRLGHRWRRPTAAPRASSMPIERGQRPGGRADGARRPVDIVAAPGMCEDIALLLAHHGARS